MKTYILDGRDLPNPEDGAMLAALYSRSTDSVISHMEKVKVRGSSNFMQKFYVGYGHNSIADLGNTWIYIEGVSMLAAKILEDTSLGAFQECSTRYIDFSTQPLYYQDEYDISYNQYTINFYLKLLNNLIEHYTEKFNPEGETELKAVKAYCFDIARAFLPISSTTNVCYYGSLRQINERIFMLKNHDLEEIRDIAHSMEQSYKIKYPNSFSLDNKSDVGAEHIRIYNKEYSYFEEDPIYTNAVAFEGSDPLNQQLDITYIPEDLDNIRKYESLKTRPRGCPPPRIYSSQFEIAGLMDFGSFRDLQRHRNGLCKIVTPNISNGFENWYLSKIPEDMKLEVQDHLDFIEERWSKNESPYKVLLGYRVPFIYQCSFEQLIYIAEIRSSKSVHPTCRTLALCIAEFINAKLPEVALHIDRTSLDNFNTSRGKADITRV